MKHLLIFVVFYLATTAYAGGYKIIAVVTEAVEADQVMVRDGTVRFKACDTCDTQTLQADPNLIIALDKRYVVAPESPRPATVIYRVADDLVVRVSYW